MSNEEATGTPLHRAVSSGDIDLIESILVSEVDLNKVDHEGFTPLHLAADVNFEKRWLSVWSQGEEKGFFPVADNYAEIAQLLIERGADVNYRDPSGNTALHLAARTFNVDVAEVLLSNRAEINALVPGVFYGRSPLLLATSSFHEIHNEQLDIVRLLIRWGARVDSVAKAGTEAPGYMLGLASRRSSYYKRALYAKILDLLHNCGCEFNFAEKFPLHVAVRRGDIKKVDALLARGEDIRGRDRDGRTPLHCAAIWNRVDIAVHLLKSNPNIVFDIDKAGWTPLHYAARWGSTSVARVLAEKVKVDSTDSKGETPLHLAVRHERLAVIRALLRRGANADHENERGVTPRDLAIDLLMGWRSPQLRQLLEDDSRSKN